VDVGLDVAVAEVHRVLEGGQRVLGHLARTAAVSEGDGTRPVEVREVSSARHHRSLPRLPGDYGRATVMPSFVSATIVEPSRAAWRWSPSGSHQSVR
jgi:hypothetical protein